MRLLVVSHTDVETVYRGKWFALRDLAPDVDTIVVTPIYWVDPEFGRRDSLPDSTVRLRFVAMPTSSNRASGRYVFMTWALLSLMRRFQPDVIYVEAEPWQAVYLQMAVLRRLLASKARLCVLSCWNTLEWKTPLRFPGSLTYRAGLDTTDLIVAVDHGAAELHRKQGFVGPIRIVPYSVNQKLYQPAPPDANILTDYNLHSHHIIGYVGRLTWRKGIQTLLDAVAKLKDTRWKLLLVGEGPYKDALTARAHALGIAERVIFAGAVPTEQVPRYMSVLNVLILPSTQEQWEQFGRVLIEAMACGVPVIGSSSGEIPYVIGNEDLVFPIGDSTALMEKITRLMREPEFLARCQAVGLRRVQDEFTNEAIARKLYDAYSMLEPVDKSGQKAEKA